MSPCQRRPARSNPGRTVLRLKQHPIMRRRRRRPPDEQQIMSCAVPHPPPGLPAALRRPSTQTARKTPGETVAAPVGAIHARAAVRYVPTPTAGSRSVSAPGRGTLPGLQQGVCSRRLWTPGTLPAARLRHASHSATNCQRFPSGYPPIWTAGVDPREPYAARQNGRFACRPVRCRSGWAQNSAAVTLLPTWLAGPVAARSLTGGIRDSRAVGAASGDLDHADARFGALRFHGRIFISSTTAASAAAVPGKIPNLPGSGTTTEPCMTPYSAGSHSMPT